MRSALFCAARHRDGRTLAVADHWYPSPKTCSACGHLLAQLSRGPRHWVCPGCGTRHDRGRQRRPEHRRRGRAGRDANTCGTNVRHEGPWPSGCRRCGPGRSGGCGGARSRRNRRSLRW
ncbi:zinc ribbon domain-containing protein [Micromonospora sp. NPDC047620]|uniref:zinc ribbon domain-containing protein n=1 Tax=Micromonospora sp. NPDC047620 TaxID=3364251 RepID=UPI00372174FC